MPRAQGAVYLFNGATGALIRRTDAPVSAAGGQFGLHDPEPLAPGDVNGDGKADYFASAYLQAAPSGEPTAGRSWVFSGATGNVLYEVNDPTPTEGGQFGFSMSKTDYNKDGVPDLYVGQAPHHISGPTIDESGGSYIFNGSDGSLLKSLELPASDAQPGGAGNIGSNLGWASVSPGDLNGDGEPDYVAGAPFEDVDPSGMNPFNCQAPTAGCLQNVGREYFFYSNVPATAPGGGGGGSGSSGSGLTSTGTTTAPADTTAPGVRRYGVTNSPFVVSGGSTPTFGVAARRHKKGTTFVYTLSEAATVRIVISRRRSGRRQGIRCVAPRRRLRHAPKCTGLLRRGTLTRVSKLGANRVAFSGRIGSRTLTPGTYSATITATDAAKNTSGPKTISFTIATR